MPGLVGILIVPVSVVKKGVRNRLLTVEMRWGTLKPWDDQNDQLRAVGFIMC
jgi:hypothetical protein